MVMVVFKSPVQTDSFRLDVDLFNKWKAANTDGFGFVYDGIIRRSRYVNEKLFLKLRPPDYQRYMMLHLRRQSLPKDGEHPFIAGHVIMMHNGFIQNYKEISRKYHYELKTGIDSEAMVPLALQAGERIEPFFRLVSKEAGGSKINVIAVNTMTGEYGMLASGDAFLTREDGKTILASEPLNNQSTEIKEGNVFIGKAY